MSHSLLLLTLASFLCSASAQSNTLSACKSDVIVDDFTVIRPATIFGELKQVNLLGGKLDPLHLLFCYFSF